MNRNEIIKILQNVNPEILDYQGSDLMKDHIINSFDIIEIITEIEEVLDIEINPEFIVWSRFVSVEEIVEFACEVERLLTRD